MDTASPPVYLNPGHPLFPYLVKIVYPQLGAHPERPRFIVRRLTASTSVYRLTEEGSTVSVIGKGSFLPGRLLQQKRIWLEREYRNLLFLRKIGFDAFPHRVARPLGDRRCLHLGLFQDWESGNHLDFFFQRAIFQQEHSALFSRLETLAFFLARLHQKTETGRPVDWTPLGTYFQKVLRQLFNAGLLPTELAQEFHRWISCWLNGLGNYPTRQVLIHGDATPTNFLFPSGRELVALDLERMKPADRVWDLGLVCGEIKHAFLWRRRDGPGAEPFIGHFLRSYASFFDEDRQMFETICRLVPFFMAVTELRIARNQYLDRPYRVLLIREAATCLVSGYPDGAGF
ncbi:MAG: aminoglycoside phosphotransferase family protein [Deltaproteobacteria bacterium]|nr:aminoglycoside phosphotransferase family protein [Deltaproteobacteria bacterium]